MELPVLTGRGVMTNLGVGFVWTKGEGGGYFFMPHWQTFVINVIKKTIEFG